ncbi:MAG: M64 family metallo-endopeptidase [Parabacteroides sp.]|nr:M64 family metallo-endopeptidase [Parabacteroides sp.]
MFGIDENTTDALRYGEIYLRGKTSDSGSVTPELTDTIKVLQQELALSTDYEELRFGPYAQKKWLTVTSTHRYPPYATDDSFTVSDYTYTLSDGAAAWCTVEKNSNNEDYLSVSVADNTTDESRSAAITVTSSTLSRTVRIEQKASMGAVYTDGEKIELQPHDPTKGNGVNVILMGDGFTKSDLELNGTYKTAMVQAAGYFFSIEPFRSYQEYFDVDMIAVESPESGVNDSATPSAPVINNALGSSIGKGTSITWNADQCAQYIISAFPQFKHGTLSDGSLYIDEEILVILVLNTPRYAGTTSLYNNGYCVAACPMSTGAAPYDFEGLVHHEAGGHGFGLFEDEYVYSENATIPYTHIAQIKQWQQAGFYQNVDFTANTAQIRWKDFIGPATYSYVGAYEGACTYGLGVWRPEEISCMDYNIPYFSAPCRMYITNRILRLAGKLELSFAGFAAADRVTPPSKTKNGVPYRTMPPLGRPRMIEVN